MMLAPGLARATGIDMTSERTPPTMRAAMADDRALRSRGDGAIVVVRRAARPHAPEIVEGEARTLRAFFDAVDPPETLLIAESRRPAKRLRVPRGASTTTSRSPPMATSAFSSSPRPPKGRALARRSCAAAEAWALARGHATLTLNVFDGNRRARALYERSGFRPDTIKYRKTL